MTTIMEALYQQQQQQQQHIITIKPFIFHLPNQ